jgi:hypothetical protein
MKMEFEPNGEEEAHKGIALHLNATHACVFPPGNGEWR